MNKNLKKEINAFIENERERIENIPGYGELEHPKRLKWWQRLFKPKQR